MTNWRCTRIEYFFIVNRHKYPIHIFSHRQTLFQRCTHYAFHILFPTVATLQLAYRQGLGALQKAQTKAEQLQAENHRLQSMVKGWSIKTTELTTETITLRQEITSLKHKLRNPSFGEYEYREFITFLCR